MFSDYSSLKFEYFSVSFEMIGINAEAVETKFNEVLLVSLCVHVCEYYD